LIPLEFRAREVYDGLEPDDYTAPLASPEALGLSAADLCRTRLLELEASLGPSVALVCAVSGLTRTTSPFAAIVDARGLTAYALRRTSGTGARELWITSYGELQPARYCGWILSMWSLG